MQVDETSEPKDGATRVAADSKGPRARFEDIEIGRVLGEMD